MCLYSFLLLLEAAGEALITTFVSQGPLLRCKVTIPAFCGRLLFNHLLTQDCCATKELNWEEL